MKKGRSMLKIFFAGVVFSAVVNGCAAALIHNSGKLIASFGIKLGLAKSTADTYAEVLNQLETAQMRLPILLVTLLCCLVCAGCSLGVQNKKIHKKILQVLSLLIIIILFLAILLFALWLTEVNDVQFGNVFRMLIQIL